MGLTAIWNHIRHSVRMARLAWLMQAGKLAEAERLSRQLLVQAAICSSHQEAELQIVLATALAALDRREEALAILESSIASCANLPAAFLLRGSILSKRGEHARGLKDLDRACDLIGKPEFSYLWERGRIKNRLCRWNEALEDLLGACQLNSQNDMVHYELSRALAKTCRYKEALCHIDKAIGLDPACIRFRLERVHRLCFLQSHEEALNEVDTVIDLDLRQYCKYGLFARHLRAAVLARLSRFDESLADLAMLTEEGDLMAMGKKSLVFSMMGNYSGALALTDDKRFCDAPGWAQLCRGIASYGVGQYGAAFDYVGHSAIQIQSGVIFAILAWLLSTCPDEEWVDWARAERLVLEMDGCQELVSWKKEKVHAAVLACKGDFVEACKRQSAVIELCSDCEYILATEENILMLYRAHRTMRDPSLTFVFSLFLDRWVEPPCE